MLFVQAFDQKSDSFLPCPICLLQQLRQTLDAGGAMPLPDGLLINGMQSASFVGDLGT
jgi:hypothetical protein